MLLAASTTWDVYGVVAPNNVAGRVKIKPGLDVAEFKNLLAGHAELTSAPEVNEEHMIEVAQSAELEGSGRALRNNSEVAELTAF